MGMFKEFKNFALKGNVVDLAVGVIIGGAFQKIVTSVISDMVMPVVSTVTGKVDFTNKYEPLSDAVQKGLSLADARAKGPVLAYGNFITEVINFIIMAFAIFIMVKMINKARELSFEKEVAATPEAPADVKLLTEIRDLLKQQRT